MSDERRLPPGLKYVDLPPRSEAVRCPTCGAEPPHLPGSPDCLRRQLAQAQEENYRLRRVLKEIEWRGHDSNESGYVCPWCGENNDVCPWCGWEKRDGHRPDCELAAALADAPDNPENPLAAYTDGQLYDELRRRGWVAATWAREEGLE